MFEKKIDNELSLVLLYSSHAEGHLKIRNDNLSFFSKRMPFFKTYNSKDMFSKWIEYGKQFYKTFWDCGEVSQ